MNCPNCGKEMESGYLYTGMSVAIWTAKPNKKTAFRDSSEVLIRDGFTGALPPACICKLCRTVVVEY